MGPLSSILFAIVSKEIVGNIENLAANILKMALRRVPSGIRTHYSSEWLMHFNDCPGPISKLAHSLGCWFAAPNVEFDTIGWQERFFYGVYGICSFGLYAHIRISRLKAKVIFVVWFFLRNHLSAENSRRIKLSACRLIMITKIETAAAYFAGLSFAAGWRIGAYRAVSDGQRHFSLSIAPNCACFYMHECAQSTDYAAIRNSLGFVVHFRARKSNKKFVEMAEAGRKIIHDLRELSQALHQLDGALAEMQRKVDADDAEKISKLRQQHLAGFCKI